VFALAVSSLADDIDEADLDAELAALGDDLEALDEGMEETEAPSYLPARTYFAQALRVFHVSDVHTGSCSCSGHACGAVDGAGLGGQGHRRVWPPRGTNEDHGMRGVGAAEVSFVFIIVPVVHPISLVVAGLS
jgi:hypothetical protein